MNNLLVLELLILAVFSLFILKNWRSIQRLRFNKSFNVNDYVLLNGEVLRVKKVGWKNLVLQINSNSPILVPLKNIEQEGIINLSKNSTPRKAHLAFKTSNKINTKKIEKLLVQIMNNHTQIIDSPRPYVSIVKLRNENVVFHLNFYSYNFDEIIEIENELKMKILDSFTLRNITHLFQKSNSSEKVKIRISNN